jgi:hypothetical protein
MANISDFKANFSGGGARSNLFQVICLFPIFTISGSVATQKIQFLCHGAELPKTTLTAHEISFQGRTISVAGERAKYEPMTLDVYNDTDFALRTAFESWADAIQNANSLQGISDPSAYQVELSINQLDRNGNILKSYTLVDCFPTEVGEIKLSFDAGGEQIETFAVAMTYNYWTTPELPSSVGLP